MNKVSHCLAALVLPCVRRALAGEVACLPYRCARSATSIYEIVWSEASKQQQ